MSRSTSSSRAWARSTCKCLSLFLLGITAWSVAAPAKAENGPVSRWSTANPPTPAAIGVLPEVSVPDVRVSSRPPSPSADNSPVADNGLRRLPPVEDTVEETPPVAEPNHSDLKPEEAPTEQPQRSASRPAGPVDWSNPHVVIGPQPTSRTVSHEEMISTPPESHAQASRYSRIAGAALQADAEQLTAATESRYAEPQVTTVPQLADEPQNSSTRQPVFARVFDETVPSDGLAEVPEEKVSTAGAPGKLSPIFACRLLGLPATKEQDASSQFGDGTATR